MIPLSIQTPFSIKLSSFRKWDCLLKADYIISLKTLSVITLSGAHSYLKNYDFIQKYKNKKYRKKP
jgi:hypothetical protein